MRIIFGLRSQKYGTALDAVNSGEPHILVGTHTSILNSSADIATT